MSQAMIGTYRYSQYAFRDSNGYAKGQDTSPETVSAGTSLNAYLYDKPVEISGLSLTYGKRQGQGGGKIWAQRSTGVSDVGNVTLTLSAFDTALDGFFKGLTPDTTTNSGMIISARNSQLGSLPSILSIHAFELDMSDGSSRWLNYVILNGQYTSSGVSAGQGTGVNPNPLSYDVTPNLSYRSVTGILFDADSNLDVASGSDYDMWLMSDYPLGLTTYIDNGVATSFTTAYQLVAGSTKADCIISTNGVENSTDVSAVAPTTGTFTITAQTSGDIWQVLYPTNFVPV